MRAYPPVNWRAIFGRPSGTAWAKEAGKLAKDGTTLLVGSPMHYIGFIRRVDRDSKIIIPKGLGE